MGQVNTGNWSMLALLCWFEALTCLTCTLIIIIIAIGYGLAELQFGLYHFCCGYFGSGSSLVCVNFGWVNLKSVEWGSILGAKGIILGIEFVWLRALMRVPTNLERAPQVWRICYCLFKQSVSYTAIIQLDPTSC